MYMRRKAPQVTRRQQVRPELEALEDRCVPAVIETFDAGNFAAYSTVLRNLPAAGTGLFREAAHDGAKGLLVKDGYEWLVRNDAGAQVARSQTISAWIRFADVADGRAYLGFGATPNDRNGTLSTGGTLSVVLAANTSQFLLQSNAGFDHSALGSPSAQTFVANQWYRVEVQWAANGNITAQLFDNNGGLLNTVNGTSTSISAGGIAFRAFGNDKHFDTIEVNGTPSATSPNVGRALIPAQTLTRTEGGASAPFQYESIPDTKLDVNLRHYYGLSQGNRPVADIGGVPTVGLAGNNNSVIYGSLTNYVQQGWGPITRTGPVAVGNVPVETPLLHQYLFRQRPGEATTLIGQSDVKHFFDSAHGTDPQHLRPGQNDTYGSALNASQPLFSPRSEVDPITGQIPSKDHFGVRNNDGVATYQAHTHTPLEHLLQVAVADLNPSTNPFGTRWFMAANLWVVGDQDHTNNSRWLEVIPNFNATTQMFTFTPVGSSYGQRDMRSIPGLPNYARIIDDRLILSGGAGDSEPAATFTGPGWSLFVGGVAGVVREGYGPDANGPPIGGFGDGTGRDGDITFAAAGNGSNTANWNFTGLQSGKYRVYVTYPEHANRATNSPFTVFDGAAPIGSPILVNQQLAPNDSYFAGVGWESLGVFTITGNQLQVSLSDDANGFVIADGVRIERVTDQIVDDGDAGFAATPGFTSFPGQGHDNDVSFAAAGNGSETATWIVTDLVPGDYRVSITWSAHPNRATNAPFQVYDDTTLLGTVLVNQELAPNHYSADGTLWFNLGGVHKISSGTLRVVLSDNADEYVIADAMRVELLTSNPVRTVDDGPNRGFDATSGFFSFGGQGYQGDVTFAAAGTGSEQATFTFTSLPPGVYRISATWSIHPNRATNAPFEVFDGTTSGASLGTHSINQELTPSDFVEGGTAWEDLGSGAFTISSGTITVRLTDLANEFVIADAIRIERLS
jgi:hypothetical protein